MGSACRFRPRPLGRASAGQASARPGSAPGFLAATWLRTLIRQVRDLERGGRHAARTDPRRLPPQGLVGGVLGRIPDASDERGRKLGKGLPAQLLPLGVPAHRAAGRTASPHHTVAAGAAAELQSGSGRRGALEQASHSREDAIAGSTRHRCFPAKRPSWGRSSAPPCAPGCRCPSRKHEPTLPRQDRLHRLGRDQARTSSRPARRAIWKRWGGNRLTSALSEHACELLRRRAEPARSVSALRKKSQERAPRDCTEACKRPIVRR
jgi:hypothetical protein